MRVKAEPDEQGSFYCLIRKDRRRHCYNEGKTDIVSQHMMVVSPPVHRMSGVLGELFGDDAQTIQVRDHTCPGYECAIPFCERRRGVGDSPADEKMCDGAHAFADDPMGRVTETQSDG